MLLLDQIGWILSPNETKKDLLQRKNAILLDPTLTPSPSHPAHDITERLFCFRFETAPIFISQSSLPPWQGAALWIYNKDINPFPVIQLGTRHSNRQTEFLAHELVHAARFAFKEPFFEEILAYQTSPSRLYRFLGPLFLFHWEPWIWLTLSFLSFGLFFFLDALYFLYLPSALLSFFIIRLTVLQILFGLAKRHLKKAGIKNYLALLLRSSDKQIIQTALCFSGEKIIKIFQSDRRFKDVLLAYFSTDTCE